MPEEEGQEQQLPPISQTLEIFLKESIAKQQRILNYLQQVNKQFKSTSRRLERYEKDANKARKSTKKLEETLFNLSKSARGSWKAIGSITKGLAKLTAVAVGVTRGALGVGSSLQKLSVYAIDGNQAIRNLRIEMESLGSQGAVAIDKAAEAIVAFNKRSLGAMITTRGIEGSFAKAMDKVTQLAGKSGLGLLEDLLGKVEEQDFGIFRQAMDQLEQGSSRWIKTLANIPSITQQVAALQDKMRDFASGMDETVKATTLWDKVTAKLGARWTEFKDKLTKAVGTDLIKKLDALATDLLPAIHDAIEDVVNFVGKNGKAIVDTFENIINKVGSLLKWLLQLEPKVQAVMGALLIAPGIAFGIAGLVTNIIALGTHLLIAATNAGMLKGAFAAMKTPAFLQGGALGAKGVGTAGRAVGGVAAGIGGHYLGQGVAGALGAEEGGIADTLSGMAGGAAAGFAIAGPMGAAIGAATSGVLSLGEAWIRASEAAEQHNKIVQQNAKNVEILVERAQAAAGKAAMPGATEHDRYISKLTQMQAELATLDVEIQKKRQEWFSADEVKVLESKMYDMQDAMNAFRKTGDKMHAEHGEYTRKMSKEAREVGRAIEEAVSRGATASDIEEIVAAKRKEVEASEMATIAEKFRKEAAEESAKAASVAYDKATAASLSSTAIAQSSHEAAMEAREKVAERMKDALIEHEFALARAASIAQGMTVEAAKKAAEERREVIEAEAAKITNEAMLDLPRGKAEDSFVVDAASYLDAETNLKHFLLTAKGGFQAGIQATQGMTDVINDLGTILQSFGPSIEIGMGRALGDALDITAIETFIRATERMDKAQQMLTQAPQARANIESEILSIQQQIIRGQISEADGVTEINLLLKERARIYKLEHDALSQVQALTQARVASVKAIGSQYERLAQTEAFAVEMAESQLDIFKNLYGTPALAVEAQLAVVNALEQQKQYVQAQLEAQQELLDTADARGLSEDEVRIAQEQIIQQQTKLNRLTAKQLQHVKELRDGYIDAVVAQAFGANRFSKILITQEKNLGIAMDSNIIKRNYLLGQVGDEAMRSFKSSSRFSASGIGVLEGERGPMSPRELAEHNTAALENISDPMARQAAQAAQDAILGIVQSTDRQVSSTDRLIKSQDKMSAAIQGFVRERSFAAAGVLAPGSPAAETLAGEMQRRAAAAGPSQPRVEGAGRLPPRVGEYAVPDRSVVPVAGAAPGVSRQVSESLRRLEACCRDTNNVAVREARKIDQQQIPPGATVAQVPELAGPPVPGMVDMAPATPDRQTMEIPAIDMKVVGEADQIQGIGADLKRQVSDANRMLDDTARTSFAARNAYLPPPELRSAPVDTGPVLQMQSELVSLYDQIDTMDVDHENKIKRRNELQKQAARLETLIKMQGVDRSGIDELESVLSTMRDDISTIDTENANYIIDRNKLMATKLRLQTQIVDPLLDDSAVKKHKEDLAVVMSNIQSIDSMYQSNIDQRNSLLEDQKLLAPALVYLESTDMDKAVSGLGVHLDRIMKDIVSMDTEKAAFILARNNREQEIAVLESNIEAAKVDGAPVVSLQLELDAVYTSLDEITKQQKNFITRYNRRQREVGIIKTSLEVRKLDLGGIDGLDLQLAKAQEKIIEIDTQKNEYIASRAIKQAAADDIATQIRVQELQVFGLLELEDQLQSAKSAFDLLGKDKEGYVAASNAHQLEVAALDAVIRVKRLKVEGITQLESDLSNAQSLLTKLYDDNKDYIDKHNTKQAEIDALVYRIDTEDLDASELETLKRQVVVAHGEITTLDRDHAGFIAARNKQQSSVASLETAIKVKNLELAGLEDLKSQLGAMEIQLSVLDENAVDFIEQRNRKQSEIDAVTSAILVHGLEVEGLSDFMSGLNGLKSQLTMMETELSLLDENSATFIEDRNKKQEDIDAVTSAISVHELQVQGLVGLNSQLNKFYVEMGGLDIKRQEYVDRRSAKEDERDALASTVEFGGLNIEQMAEHKAQLKQVHTDLDSMDAEFSGYLAYREKRQADIKSLETFLFIENLKLSGLESLKSQLVQSRRDINKLDENSVTFIKDHNIAQEKIDAIVSSISVKELKVDGLTGLRSQLDKFYVQMDGLNVKKQGYTDQLNAHEKELDELISEIKFGKLDTEQITEHQSQLQRVYVQIDSVNADLANYIAFTNKKQADIDSLRASIKIENLELSGLERLEYQLLEAERKLSSLDERVPTFIEDRARSQEKIDDITSTIKIKELQVEGVAVLRSQLDKFYVDLGALDVEHQSYIDQHNVMEKERESIVSRLKVGGLNANDLQVLHGNLKDVYGRIDSLDTEFVDYIQSRNRKQAQIDKLVTAIHADGLESSGIDELKYQLSQLQREMHGILNSSAEFTHVYNQAQSEQEAFSFYIMVNDLDTSEIEKLKSQQKGALNDVAQVNAEMASNIESLNQAQEAVTIYQGAIEFQTANLIGDKELQKQFDVAIKRVEHFNQEIASFEKQKKELQAEQSDIRLKLSGEFDDSELAKLGPRLEGAQEELERLKKSHSSTIRSLNEKKSEALVLDQKINAEDIDKSKLPELRAQYDEIIKEVKTLNDRVLRTAELEKQIKLINHLEYVTSLDVEAANEAITKSERDIATLDGRIERYGQSRDEQMAQSRVLETTLHARELNTDEIKRLEGQLGTVTSEIQSITKEMAKLIEEEQEKVDRIKTIDAELSVQLLAKEVNTEQVDKMKKEQAAALERVKIIQSERDTFVSQINNREDQQEAIKTEMKVKTDTGAGIQTLLKHLKNTREELAGLDKELNKDSESYTIRKEKLENEANTINEALKAANYSAVKEVPRRDELANVQKDYQEAKNKTFQEWMDRNATVDEDVSDAHTQIARVEAGGKLQDDTFILGKEKFADKLRSSKEKTDDMLSQEIRKELGVSPDLNIDAALEMHKKNKEALATQYGTQFNKLMNDTMYDFKWESDGKWQSGGMGVPSGRHVKVVKPLPLDERDQMKIEEIQRTIKSDKTVPRTKISLEGQEIEARGKAENFFGPQQLIMRDRQRFGSTARIDNLIAKQKENEARSLTAQQKAADVAKPDEASMNIAQAELETAEGQRQTFSEFAAAKPGYTEEQQQRETQISEIKARPPTTAELPQFAAKSIETILGGGNIGQFGGMLTGSIVSSAMAAIEQAALPRQVTTEQGELVNKLTDKDYKIKELRELAITKYNLGDEIKGKGRTGINRAILESENITPDMVTKHMAIRAAEPAEVKEPKLLTPKQMKLDATLKSKKLDLAGLQDLARDKYNITEEDIKGRGRGSLVNKIRETAGIPKEERARIIPAEKQHRRALAEYRKGIRTQPSKHRSPVGLIAKDVLGEKASRMRRGLPKQMTAVREIEDQYTIGGYKVVSAEQARKDDVEMKAKQRQKDKKKATKKMDYAAKAMAGGSQSTGEAMQLMKQAIGYLMKVAGLVDFQATETPDQTERYPSNRGGHHIP